MPRPSTEEEGCRSFVKSRVSAVKDKFMERKIVDSNISKCEI